MEVAKNTNQIQTVYKLMKLKATFYVRKVVCFAEILTA